MITISAAVVIAAVVVAYRYLNIGIGSLLFGIGIGAAFSTATFIAPLGQLTQSGSTSIGTSLQSAADRVIK